MRIVLFLGFGVLVIAVVIGGWLAMYPSINDPKNIQYVLWKAHLYPMNLDAAVYTMGFDPHRHEMILGHTEEELTEKFGYLTPMSKAPMELQRCYAESVWRKYKAMFIRKSDLMVAFTNDHANSVVTMKGC